MTIAGLPGSFWVVVGFAAFGVCLVTFFSAKRLIFLKYKRAGESAFLQGRHEEAIRWLGNAERLWSLNVATQSARSFLSDINEIDAILSKIEAASGFLGRDVPTGDYRTALEGLREQFSKFGASSERKPHRTGNYGSAHVQLDEARRKFRQKLQRAIALRGK